MKIKPRKKASRKEKKKEEGPICQAKPNADEH